MTLPNLVIAGAPKCGTSSLFNWLVDHPDVCGSDVKETFFLMDEGHPLRRANSNFQDLGLAGYAAHFAQCGKERVVVEATTHYMFQKTALDVLATLPTQPKVLFLLREPSERVFSSFAYSKSKGYAKGDLSFADFLGLVGDGDEDALRLALGPSAYVLSNDVRYSHYIDYLEPWVERIGLGRMRVLLFDAMRSDPKRFMGDLCAWLGLDPSFYDSYDFTARNSTVAIRSRGLQSLARWGSTALAFGLLRNTLKSIYLSVQSKPKTEQRSQADQDALAKLDEEYRSSNERLRARFELDLNAWD